ncbi:MAG: nucleic acid-binding protein [Chloroflexota bacterium]|nr:nucleic acid-binding protein [Chloroflexota bacterium]
MILTFIDAGVLIAAARGPDPAVMRRATAILADPNRVFASSPFLQLEVLPKPVYFKRQKEVAFYQTYFQAVTKWATCDEAFIHLALTTAQNVGMGALDALHIAAALEVGAQEFVTTERSTKPIHRATGVTVVSIHP